MNKTGKKILCALFAFSIFASSFTAFATDGDIDFNKMQEEAQKAAIDNIAQDVMKNVAEQTASAMASSFPTLEIPKASRTPTSIKTSDGKEIKVPASESDAVTLNDTALNFKVKEMDQDLENVSDAKVIQQLATVQNGSTSEIAMLIRPVGTAKNTIAFSFDIPALTAIETAGIQKIEFKNRSGAISVTYNVSELKTKLQSSEIGVTESDTFVIQLSLSKITAEVSSTYKKNIKPKSNSPLYYVTTYVQDPSGAIIEKNQELGEVEISILFTDITKGSDMAYFNPETKKTMKAGKSRTQNVNATQRRKAATVPVGCYYALISNGQTLEAAPSPTVKPSVSPTATTTPTPTPSDGTATPTPTPTITPTATVEPTPEKSKEPMDGFNAAEN